MIALARLVLVEQHRNRRHVEKAAIAQYGPAQRRPQALLQRTAEPSGEGHHEPLLGPIENLSGDMWFERGLEYIFALPSVQLQLRRQSRGPFNQRMVQQRHAHLERARHARPINLGEDISWQIGLEIGILHLRQRVFAAACHHVPAQHLGRMVALQFPSQAGTKQPASKVVAADRDGREIGVDGIARELLQGCFRP